MEERYPTKKQSFSQEKDCFFVGYLSLFSTICCTLRLSQTFVTSYFARVLVHSALLYLQLCFALEKSLVAFFLETMKFLNF